MLKRRQSLSKREKELLKIIRYHLSDEFKHIQVKSVDKIPELADIIVYSELCITKAKIDENNLIHIKIENTNGFIYEGFTKDYKWFLEIFSF